MGVARNEKKRQKKLEKKRMDRKVQQSKVARLKSGGLHAQFTQAAHWPIVASLASDPDDRLRHTYLVRRSNEGLYAIASFLVDLNCLGVKDTFGRVVASDQYQDLKEQLDIGPVPAHPVSPAFVRKLVEQSVEYARGIGLPPHVDYDKVKLLFGDIDAASCHDEFTFGFNGKPVYVVGASDRESMRRRVSKIVLDAGGVIDDTMSELDPDDGEDLEWDDDVAVFEDDLDDDDVVNTPMPTNVIEAVFERRES